MLGQFVVGQRGVALGERPLGLPRQPRQLVASAPAASRREQRAGLGDPFRRFVDVTQVPAQHLAGDLAQVPPGKTS